MSALAALAAAGAGLAWIGGSLAPPREVLLEPLPTLGRGPRPDTVQPAASDAIEVADVPALRQALREAGPGRTIQLRPGIYRIESKLVPQRAGRADAPIVLRGGPGVRLESVTTEAIKLDQPHWVFERLLIVGRCPRGLDCEHAFHIVGGATGTVIRDNVLEEFNAAVKVNGEQGRFPDDGRLLHNRIANLAPRTTDLPVAPVDIVAASGWIVSDNIVANFVKDGSNRVSYGIFMKGGGSGGRIERNLVVCTTSGVSQPGARVGISLGGGTTGRAFCRDLACTVEHSNGVVANNVVAHCNDAGIDVNRSTGSDIRHNTLINTAGILVRGEPSSARVRTNLMDGRLRVRPPARADAEHNLVGDTRRWWNDADGLTLAWISRPDPVPTSDEAADFCGRPRGDTSLPGALAGQPC
jgi:hypothetical protein